MISFVIKQIVVIRFQICIFDILNTATQHEFASRMGL